MHCRIPQATQLQVRELAPGSRGILNIRRAPSTPQRPGSVKATARSRKHSALRAQPNLHMPLEPNECLLADNMNMNEFSTVSTPTSPNMLTLSYNTISSRTVSRAKDQSDAEAPFQDRTQTERVRKGSLLDTRCSSLNSAILKSKFGHIFSFHYAMRLAPCALRY